MVVFEGGAPKKSDYRRFTIRTVEGSDDFASMAEVLARRYAQWEKQAEKSPYDADRDASFAALPNLVVIDGGPGQLSAGLEPLQGFVDRGVAVVSLAKRIEEVFFPGRAEPLRLAHDTPELQLLQRVRDEAHRFAITHHRIRRDKAMTRVDHGRAAGHRPGAQARAAQALRLARGGARRDPRRARGGARRAPEGGARAVRAPESDRSMSDDPAMSGNGAAPPDSNLVDLVIISGHSGAGKSSAMNVFEDAGYFCVDNLPPEMIRSLAELFVHEGSKVERAAVVSDLRGGEYFDDARARARDAALATASRTA